MASSEVIEEYACFNTVFEITCGEDETIVFETARYGRNDTGIASRCQVPFQRNCDVDVHFPLNRVCAGKHRCSLAVNTALFGDPCGYEEFLKVTYRCVPGWLLPSFSLINLRKMCLFSPIKVQLCVAMTTRVILNLNIPLPNV